jgi:hypothetical protein
MGYIFGRRRLWLSLLELCLPSCEHAGVLAFAFALSYDSHGI